MRADSRLVSVARLARPVRPSVREAAVLRNIVVLIWFSETITTAIESSAHGPSTASTANIGAAIRLIPQIRTLLPNRSRCARQVETRSRVSANASNSEYITTTTTASASPQMVNRHAPGGINGSKVSEIPDSNATASPITPNTTVFNRVCHHGPLR